jgi:hypothetical protein
LWKYPDFESRPNVWVSDIYEHSFFLLQWANTNFHVSQIELEKMCDSSAGIACQSEPGQSNYAVAASFKTSSQ